MVDLKHIKNVYFIGIGGIGMSALARYFNSIGMCVHGYDRTATEITNALEAEGISVHFKDAPEQIPTDFQVKESTLVIYTPAIKKLKELDFFRSNGFSIYKRAQVLGMITRTTKCLAVAGTHGKTTTTSILAHLLVECNASVSAFLGGISENFNSNFITRGNEYSVVEADEFDRSFLQLSPDIACITSMDADHLDIYENEEKLKEAFNSFIKQINPNGKLLVCEDLPLNGIYYGLNSPKADYTFENINIQKGLYHFDVRVKGTLYKNYTFGKPGHHNLLNALAALAMATEAGFPVEKLASALSTFKGVKRRFSYALRNKNHILIDDYAHHPSEINALFQGVKEMHPDKRITIVFQPHLFSRTRDFMDDFAKALSKFDRVLLLDIYPAREEPIEGVHSSVLLQKIDNKDKFLISKKELLDWIEHEKPELLLVVGAGDIGMEVAKIKKILDKK